MPSAATPDGQYGVAAAIAMNFGAPTAMASVASTATLNIGGAFALTANTNYNASALAAATAVEVTSGIAGAVAIDVASPSASVSIAGSVTSTLGDLCLLIERAILGDR